jgi:hypothetical protein
MMVPNSHALHKAGHGGKFVSRDTAGRTSMRISINSSKLRARIANAALTLLIITPLCAAETDTPESPYAPYAFLIGEWDVTPEAGGPTAAVVSYRWGPNQSYIFNSVSELRNGVPMPHLKGIMIYTRITRMLETLVEIDLIKGHVLEKGSFTLQHGTLESQSHVKPACHLPSR